ncbi:thioredoxin-like protein [Scheffersomyces amazonensis]|uniref:thioredoxin-like protein n=1 Tax=Scheffersomyces amazonensis TaxID=1078765 RepID=UPI00315D828C
MSESLSSSIRSSNDKFYEFEPKDSNEKPYSFDQLKGQIVLIVNVASKCGFTPQYKELEILNKKYYGKNVQIIGFPCNQFLRQEPGTSEQIADFCYMNYGVTFPVLNKIKVNGRNADPVYKYLKDQKAGILGFSFIKWNFEKFLIDREGNVVKRYSSFTKPETIGQKIDELLKEYEDETDKEDYKEEEDEEEQGKRGKTGKLLVV